MASGVTISQLPVIPSCQLTDIIAEVQPPSGVGSTTYKATLQQVLTLFQTQPLFPYTVVTGLTQLMSPNNGYVSDNALQVTLTLPTVSVVGSKLEITGKGAGGWLIAQNAGQQIQIGNTSSTVGVAGSVASSNQGDSLVLVSIVADTIWACLGAPQSSALIIL
jgi:hypothetical protein